MASEHRTQRTYADYTIACICPIGFVLAPVEAILDEIHESLPTSHDPNVYTLGAIGRHNVVVALILEIGNDAVAAVAAQLLIDFPNVRFGLLVGIGGGVPGDSGDDDVRLGDVVVSQPTNTFGGLVQYDLRKGSIDGGFERTGQLNKPPAVLSASVRRLQAQHLRLGTEIPTHLAEMIRRYPKMQERYSLPETEPDQLFLSSYTHQGGAACQQCDSRYTVSRFARSDHEPRIHYGTIGSTNVAVKDPSTRDALKKDMHVLCVEMEASGLMNNFPCLVIRGICDYSDSHKNEKWQPYAAAVAAAYMKELLMVVSAQQVLEALKVEGVIMTDYHSGHRYTGITVDGRVKAHFGDVYHQYSAPSDTISPATSKACGLCLSLAPQMDPAFFKGRSAEIDEMRFILKPADHSGEQVRLVLGGIGGMGKTQLAITYAQRHSSDYDSVFWLNASSEATLKTSFRRIAERALEQHNGEKLKEEDIILQVSRWLSDTSNTRWLMIFDNYDNPDQFDIQQYYPLTAHGSIIVTTRRPARVGGTRVRVRPLQHIDDSLEILETRSQRSNVKSGKST